MNIKNIQRWELVKDLLHQTMQLSPERRSSFLDEACSSDVSLRVELESLLAAKDDVRSSFLQSPSLADAWIGVSLGGVESEIGLEAGQVFSQRFQLVRRLGEGGMGQVWLAEQISPVRRQVALKLIKAGMYDQAIMQRFHLEQQSLAIMDHPAIAKVFDAGTTEQGQPYFVMEYVPGQRITECCDQKRLTISQRLELFIKACEGVQHAHQKAIIHRDLKPANILVVEVDGKPQPRIIDFGLAKATTRGDGDGLSTQFGGLVGTPAYMSPEQASGHDIDTRTDVYSLGVVLYALLTGELPLDTKQWQKDPLEVMRKLREEEPARPSERVSIDRESSTATAKARDTEPTQLVTLLRGDLDWITMKAIEKDRTRRYGSPSELAADIQRYLKHEPVVARPASAGYRLQKYIRRHRVEVAVAAVLVLLLAGFAGVQSMQLRHITRERDRANREAAIADAVNEFLQNDLLAQASPSAQAGRHTMADPDLKVRTALDRAAERIEGKFAEQPEVEASIRDTMGWAYADLGLFLEAQKQLERALQLRRRILGAEHAKTLTSTSRFGWVARLQGKYAQAEALESQAWEAQRRVLGPEHPDTLASENNLAIIYRDEGKYAQAEGLHAQTLEIQKRVLGPEHPDTLISMIDLANDYDDEGKYAQSEPLFTQGLEIQKRVLGPEHPDALRSMTDLAIVYNEEGKYVQAESLVAQTLEVQKRVLGPEHRDTLTSMSGLAWVYEREGNYAQAEGLYNQILEIERRLLGPENPDTAETVYNLGCLAARRGDKDRAIALLSQSVDHISPRDGLLMETDNDLASLRGDPRFEALVAHAKQIADAKGHTGQESK